ncbi:MAG: cysteine--tRNA ligase [Candidatus Dormibacteraeota bacterium]|nr:cysteine--tRNA ligase [Candidatus Dormibacteraeota bacterium]
MSLRLHDTLTKGLVEVEPLQPGHVRLYTCGPTVWNRVHIGNFRTFVFEDVLRRWLDRNFDRVTHVMNLTDVDDRILRNAKEHGNTLDEETAPWIAAFHDDRETLGIRPAHHYPRATEYIDQMVALVQRLEDRGAAYSSSGSEYFHIAAFPQYGRLSGISAEGLVAGAGGRVDADDYTKEDVRDFALWKAVDPGDIGWETPLGRGHPGWHIECSAMSMTLLGETIDIHCGGVDNIFPHHENEIAQSEAATGRQFVRVWAHSAHLVIGGEKMSKRLGNFMTVPELVAEGARPAAVRFMLAASAHYRKQLSFADEPLRAATEAVERLVAFRDRVAALEVTDEEGDADELVRTVVRQARMAFEDAMNDDLNLPEAMGAVFVALREANRILDESTVSGDARTALQHLLADVDDVLGIFPLVDVERAVKDVLTHHESELLRQREAARAAGDWALSDRLRRELTSCGIAVEDTPQGQRWRRP